MDYVLAEVLPQPNNGRLPGHRFGRIYRLWCRRKRSLALFRIRLAHRLHPGRCCCSHRLIAATSIANRLGLPKRITDVLEGESLVNDATGLLALEFGTAIVVYGQTPTFSSGILRLAYLAAIGMV